MKGQTLLVKFNDQDNHEVRQSCYIALNQQCYQRLERDHLAEGYVRCRFDGMTADFEVVGSDDRLPLFTTCVVFQKADHKLMYQVPSHWPDEKIVEAKEGKKNLEKPTFQEKFVNHYGYSDVEPFEIIRIISDQTIEIRPMKCEKDPTWNPEIIPGGFAGHCVNQSEQRWIITSCPDAETFRIRKKKNGKWGKDGRWKLSDHPRKFYDYNF